MYNKTRVTLIIIIVLLFIQSILCNQKLSRDIEDTELLMTFLVHRHGDRTLMNRSVFIDDPQEYFKLSEPYGPGDLDEAGKARSYQLGKSFRRRYNEFLLTNFSNLFVQSTDYNRTIMTARIAVTAAYSPELYWYEGMNLIPFNYTVVPIADDYNLAVQNCPKFVRYVDNEYNANPEVLTLYDNVTRLVASDCNVTIGPVMLYIVYGVYCSQMSLGMPLSPEITAILPQIAKGASAAIDVIYGKKEYLPLQAGVLLREFFKRADQNLRGEVIPRMRVYSGHDFNVYSFVAVSGATPRQGMPIYCSSFALELRRVRSTGQVVVLPVYVATPGDPEQYLKIEGCSGALCDFEEFRNITFNRTLDAAQYRPMCNDTSTNVS